MNVYIYDTAGSVLSAGLSYVISINFPDANVVRKDNLPHAVKEKVDLLILFQEAGGAADPKDWKRVKELCGNAPCLALLDTPTFKELKNLLCGFPIKMIATTQEINDALVNEVLRLQSDSILFYSNAIKNIVFEYLCKNDDDDESNIHLTRRENQVLQLVREGQTASEIADRLDLSVNTVQVFLSKLRKKFKVRNTLSLVHRKQ